MWSIYKTDKPPPTTKFLYAFFVVFCLYWKVILGWKVYLKTIGILQFRKYHMCTEQWPCKVKLLLVFWCQTWEMNRQSTEDCRAVKILCVILSGEFVQTHENEWNQEWILRLTMDFGELFCVNIGSSLVKKIKSTILTSNVDNGRECVGTETYMGDLCASHSVLL